MTNFVLLALLSEMFWVVLFFVVVFFCLLLLFFCFFSNKLCIRNEILHFAMLKLLYIIIYSKRNLAFCFWKSSNLELFQLLALFVLLLP